MRNIVLILSLWCFCNSVQAAVQGKVVNYQAEDVTLHGYIAYDDAIKGKRPAVLVVPDWWGQNEFTHKRARMLAELGYTAMVVDMFGNGKTTDNPAVASKLSDELNGNLSLEWVRFSAGLNLLGAQETVDANEMAALGYGFGGNVLLNMARIGASLNAVPLKGVVSFYGGLSSETPAKEGKVKSRIISFTGENDPLVEADKVEAFKLEMKVAKADFRVVTYPGAQHAFSDPDSDALGKKFNLPIAYDAKADSDSWQQTTEFLRKVFAPK